MSTVNRPSMVKPERVSVLILGAGSGDRIGRRPKAFLRLDGRTLLERAVALVSPFATEIIVGVRPEDWREPGDSCRKPPTWSPAV